METQQLNRVLLRGFVGSIRTTEVQDTKVAHITLATNYAYKDRSGCVIIETTWHSLTAWSSPTMPDLTQISKGDRLYVEGRIRNQRYTGADGVERTSQEILVSRLQILKPEEHLTMEV